MTWNWHSAHADNRTVGERTSDAIAGFIGSWRGIIWSNGLVVVWISLNLTGWVNHWDPYPFILLNLVFSWQGYNSAPLIMMSQNRQADRDRHQADFDLQTNIAAKEEIEALQKDLARIENEKLDLILAQLGAKKGN